MDDLGHEGVHEDSLPAVRVGARGPALGWRRPQPTKLKVTVSYGPVGLGVPPVPPRPRHSRSERPRRPGPLVSSSAQLTEVT